MKKTLMISFVLLLMFSCVSFAVDFTADMRPISISRAGVEGKGKAFLSIKVSGEKEYMVTTLVQGNPVISVNRRDKNISWVLIPDLKQAVISQLPKNGGGNNLLVNKDRKGVGQKVGRENIGGVMCDKYKMVAKGKKGMDTTYTWISADNVRMKVLICYASGIAAGNELINFKKTKLPASLFEIPEGYEKVESPN